MRFDILSLFPEYFKGPFDVSILKRARESGRIEIGLLNIRSFAEGKHQQVDDRPYGGGPGMVLMPKPVTRAIRSVKKEKSRVIYLSPQGKLLTARKCQALAQEKHLILLCGHYEGVDQRVIDLEVDEEVSIGDFVVTSGAPAAILLVDAVARFVPGVVGNQESIKQDSFQNGVFDPPVYTTPSLFEHLEVPPVLRSGDHAQIDRWRKDTAYRKTKHVRPDLIQELIEKEK